MGKGLDGHAGGPEFRSPHQCKDCHAAHIYHAVLGAQRQEGPQSLAANQSNQASEFQ